LKSDLDEFVAKIRACRICLEEPLKLALPHEPRPVLRVSPTAKLLIASQAPGVRVNLTGLSFNDASGDRLRDWMGVSREIFYDLEKIAIVPMGFCFPGHDAKKGDLPPRPECQKTWHDDLFELLPQIELILTIGRYAQNYHFSRAGRPLPKGLLVDDVVRGSAQFSAGLRPKIIALPHPSWRNSGWLKKNPWFATEVLPFMRSKIAEALN